MYNVKCPTAEQCTNNAVVFEDENRIGYAMCYVDSHGGVGINLRFPRLRLYARLPSSANKIGGAKSGSADDQNARENHPRNHVVLGNDTSDPMKPNELILHGLLRREPQGYWAAYCLDFTLYATGETAEEAMDKLRVIVDEYLTDALVGNDQDYAAELLHRKAPIGDWMRFYVLSRSIVF